MLPLSCASLAYTSYWFASIPPQPIPPEPLPDPPNFPDRCSPETEVKSKANCYLSGLSPSWTVVESFSHGAPNEVTVVRAESKLGTAFAFAGTHDWATFALDMEYRLVPFEPVEGTMAERGFYCASKAAEPWLQVQMQTAQKDVYFVGHSQGGAIACLSALFCHQLDPNKTYHVYTFGSPRPGDAALKRAGEDLLKDNHVRYHLHWDLIPYLPPVWEGYASWEPGCELPCPSDVPHHALYYYIKALMK